MYDEAGKIDRDFFSLTLPFTSQDTNFITGGGINSELYPLQMPNKVLLLSSAEGVDSELFDRYKIAFNRMLLGDKDYFVCDIDCSFSLHPYMNGKPMKPLISQSKVDDAFKTNPYRATREYYNKFDQDGGQDVFIKRSVLNKFCETYYPVYENDGEKKYIIAYDPATKLDNSIIMVGELFKDADYGYMVKLVNCVNLIEVLKSGEKMVIQKPEQIERLKDLILDYNKGALDYQNIDQLIIDSGAGGGGVDIAQFLMNEWTGKDKRTHIGFIDPEDEYMKMRIDDYPANAENLKMFNFKRDKVTAYTRAQNAINQGLVIFPNSLNARNELEFTDQDIEGNPIIRYEKVDQKELNSLVQLDLAKEEIIATQKVKKSNGTIAFELSPDAKSKNMHDDRVDCIVMILNRLMEIRADEALTVEQKKKTSDFKEALSKIKTQGHIKNNNNPFNLGDNPFADLKNKNPF